MRQLLKDTNHSQPRARGHASTNTAAHKVTGRSNANIQRGCWARRHGRLKINSLALLDSERDKWMEQKEAKMLGFHLIDKINSRSETKQLCILANWSFLKADGPSHHRAFTKQKEKQVNTLNWNNLFSKPILYNQTRREDQKYSTRKSGGEKKSKKTQGCKSVVSDRSAVRNPPGFQFLSSSHPPGPHQVLP